MQALLQYFFKGHLLPGHSRVFKLALYVFVILKCLYWLFHYELLFGADSIIYRAEGHTNFIKDIAYVLYNNKSTMLPFYFIIASIGISVLMLLRKKTNLTADLVLWLLVENLHFSIYATLTGGDYLLNQLLFFNIFITLAFAGKRDEYRELYVCLHNAAVTGVIMQVCIVYAVSGLAKLTDATWMNGSAVEAVNRLDHFSLGLASGSQWTPMQRFFNYLVLFYQLLFPVLIWIRKIKIPFLVLGIIMHLYIAFMLGLVAFGLVMVISYVYFWPQKPRPAQI